MDEEALSFIEKPSLVPRDRRVTGRHNPTIPWLLVAVLSTYILVSSSIPHSKSSNTQLWTPSDFISARSAIQRTTTQFTSSLDFIDRKRIYRVSDPSIPIYIGNATSTAEIDQNWDDLILPADIYITDAESSTLPPDVNLYRSPEMGQYKIELEVFHSLHCLNMIRKRVYAEEYPEMLSANAIVHVDHCIESLRELIMCEGNMTPIPIEWSEKGERINPNYAQKHSCRDFDALKEWTKGRAEKSP
ncbi:hypothetical protein PMZ80_009499 [Knufia obscura]|uniref:Uncharacterized protein n=2 Tax=Knufia TaxID=430999 RepID=A0AAN8EA12_9EURO|nr:hypothetical protein PMZ80_009499 [Knufia obscura]KAK5949563.1 hypothetical protein OHC33_009370 [Knufia fluminis]